MKVMRSEYEMARAIWVSQHPDLIPHISKLMHLDEIDVGSVTRDPVLFLKLHAAADAMVDVAPSPDMVEAATRLSTEFDTRCKEAGVEIQTKPTLEEANAFVAAFNAAHPKDSSER